MDCAAHKGSKSGSASLQFVEGGGAPVYFGSRASLSEKIKRFQERE